MIANPHAISRIAKQQNAELGLLPLSLQRVRPHETPRAPSNEDRLRAWDHLRPREVTGNAIDNWADLARRVLAARATA